MKVERINTDILIIGGGTAGCYAAITIAENSDLNVVVAEKANIKRSGCLAAGVNALNAYIVKGKTPEFYVDYAKGDAEDIVREDLLITIAERLNKVTYELEKMGLVILKDSEGNYVTRGNRNVKINGENIKPILAKKVSSYPNIDVINRINIIDYIVKDNQILGAFGIGVDEEVFYVINSKAVICATGGAAGIYKPNNPGFSQHKMWYPPFNTGAGYAMGIKAGAEMTTFEMRFIALRCKDTIAPTGTIAQGVKAKQINSLGKEYESKYGITTSQRLYGTVRENIEGRGPCYLQREGISDEQSEDLMKAYLNMAPSQTLKWIDSGKKPNEENVEIEGTEPYIVGGHTASGYWIDTNRQTTIKGLFAAGDVAGGAPQKYVTGALAEGEIAAISSIKYVNESSEAIDISEDDISKKLEEVEYYLKNKGGQFTFAQLEEAMQKVMDNYAGGIKTNYTFNENSLEIAKQRIQRIEDLTKYLKADDMQE
ncbi:MAG: adenylyl-sulfate reductase subunit alpha, partial [Intestinibacter sp.]